MATPLLDDAFIAHLASIGHRDGSPYTWQLSALVALGGYNYAEEIPHLYKRLLDEYIPEQEQKAETRKFREALTKACGIWGAAKTGEAVRALASVVPPELDDRTCYREHETLESATQRGHKMWHDIYEPIPGYDLQMTEKACPDYAWIASNLLYGFVFSFDQILPYQESAQAMVSALYSIDCPNQARNHMKGMMLQGARRDDIEAFRAVVLTIGEKLGVRFKNEPIPVPQMVERRVVAE